METLNDKNELKKRALLAKQRLKMGYWQVVKAEKEKSLSNNPNANSLKLISDMQKSKVILNNSLALGCVNTSANEALYIKVCEILNSDEVILNPIGRLVDQNVYQNLDEGGKQKYIFDLSKKYRELKERFHKEQLLRQQLSL